MSDWEKISENPIFIGGHRKSGTTMFLSLLDGHNELFTYPSESGFFYAFYPAYDDSYSFDEKKKRVIDFIFRQLEDGVNKWLGDVKSKKFSFDELVANFENRINGSKKTNKDFLDAIIYAARQSLSINRENHKMWIEKTTSSEIYANDIFKWYPKAKFIHLLRDPRDNFGSIKSGWDKCYKNQFDSKQRLLQSLIDRSKLGMELAGINQKLFGKDRYLIVRFEDVVSKPQETLGMICEFLNINFDNSLMTPSFCGCPWTGNNYEGKTFDKISSINMNRWRERVDEHEAKVIEFYFRDLMPEYGYELAYSLEESADAASKHYKWFNYAQVYSLKTKLPGKQG